MSGSARLRGDTCTGTLTVIQRFGGGLNLNIHFHTLALDGVFSEGATGGLRFHPAPPPSDDEVVRLLATIRARVLRLLRRRGLADDEDVPPPDPLAEESLALAGISSASVLGRIALGRRAGARVWRLGHDPEALWGASSGPRQAHLDGFDLPPMSGCRPRTEPGWRNSAVTSVCAGPRTRGIVRCGEGLLCADRSSGKHVRCCSSPPCSRQGAPLPHASPYPRAMRSLP